MDTWISILLGILVMSSIFTGRYLADNGGDELIQKCELNLPRTQHCVLVAVPEQEVK